MGRVTQYVYDSRNRQIAVIQPHGSVLRTEYDGGGRVVATTDANGNTTQYVYDKLGRQIEKIQPDPDTATGHRRPSQASPLTTTRTTRPT